jgi:hypothetical protein
MTADEPPRFSAEETIQIASKLTVDDAAFVIGGQATNLWVWFYRPREPKLQTSSPLTSRDIDYFGTPEVARVFADAIGGKLVLPTMDHMNTPNSAMVHASINGKPVVIDFMHGVLGVKQHELHRGVSIIAVEADVDGKTITAEIPVLHPILCLKSRVANMLSPIMRRRTPVAWEQLRATVIVVQRHIEEALANGHWNEAHECLSALFRYLRSDEFGKKADKELNVDILDIIRAFRNDARIDRRYRGFQLKSMITRIETRRAGRRG